MAISTADLEKQGIEVIKTYNPVGSKSEIHALIRRPGRNIGQEEVIILQSPNPQEVGMKRGGFISRGEDVSNLKKSLDENQITQRKAKKEYVPPVTQKASISTGEFISKTSLPPSRVITEEVTTRRKTTPTIKKKPTIREKIFSGVDKAKTYWNEPKTIEKQQEASSAELGRQKYKAKQKEQQYKKAVKQYEAGEIKYSEVNKKYTDYEKAYDKYDASYNRNKDSEKKASTRYSWLEQEVGKGVKAVLGSKTFQTTTDTLRKQSEQFSFKSSSSFGASKEFKKQGKKGRSWFEKQKGKYFRLGAYSTGLEVGAREQLTEKPLATAGSFALGFGFSSVAGISSPFISKGLVSGSKIAKGISFGSKFAGYGLGGAYAGTKGYELYKAESPTERARILGSSTVELGAFIGGAYTGTKLFPVTTTTSIITKKPSKLSLTGEQFYKPVKRSFTTRKQVVLTGDAITGKQIGKGRIGSRTEITYKVPTITAAKRTGANWQESLISNRGYTYSTITRRFGKNVYNIQTVTNPKGLSTSKIFKGDKVIDQFTFKSPRTLGFLEDKPKRLLKKVSKTDTPRFRQGKQISPAKIRIEEFSEEFTSKAKQLTGKKVKGQYDIIGESRIVQGYKEVNLAEPLEFKKVFGVKSSKGLNLYEKTVKSRSAKLVSTEVTPKDYISLKKLEYGNKYVAAGFYKTQTPTLKTKVKQELSSKFNLEYNLYRDRTALDKLSFDLSRGRLLDKRGQFTGQIQEQLTQVQTPRVQFQKPKGLSVSPDISALPVFSTGKVGLKTKSIGLLSTKSLSLQQQRQFQKQTQLQFQRQRQLQLQRQVSLQIQTQKQLQLQRQVSLQIQPQRLLQLQRQTSIQVQQQKQVQEQKQIQQQRQVSLQLQIQPQLQIQRQRQRMRIGEPFKFSYGKVPPVGIPDLFKSPRIFYDKRVSLFSAPKRKFKYTPSIYASTFKIKGGTKRQRKALELSGLGVRPL